MNTLRRISFLTAALALLMVVGCGSKVTRTVDVSNGEFYDEEEFAKLSKEQRDAYCAQLDGELARLNSEATAEAGKVSNLEGDLSGLQGEIRNLQNRFDSANGDVAGLRDEIDYFEGLPTQHTVVDGEFLYKISGYESIYADPLKWPRIYRANKDRINDPNLIYPDWVLAIPRDWPDSWVVRQDEYLGKIAGYWEVYDDISQWPRLHEANRD